MTIGQILPTKPGTFFTPPSRTGPILPTEPGTFFTPPAAEAPWYRKPGWWAAIGGGTLALGLGAWLAFSR